MTSDKKLLILAIVAVSFGIAFWWDQARPTHAQTESNVMPWRPHWLNLEDKAKSAENNDPESVRALVDEVFSQPHGFSRLPPTIEDPLKERLVRAELNYRNGQGHPVKESDIVRLANSFADKLALPDYARTSEQMVRDVRLRSLLYTPTLMGKGITRREDGTDLQVGESINPTMSPIQAVHLSLFLVESKIYNSDYQMTPDQWISKQYQRTTTEWQEAEVARILGRKPSTPQESGSSPRIVEGHNVHIITLINAVEKGLQGINPDDALSLGHSALDTLGIERGDK